MAEDKKEDTEKSSRLKPSQIVASALAAVTAAFLGSTLGTTGTIAGAGIASIITTVGGEVYLRSLRKTHSAARKTKDVLVPDLRLRQETRLVEPPPRRPANPLMSPQPPMRRGQFPPVQPNAAQRTRRIPAAGNGASLEGQRTVYIPRPGAPATNRMQGQLPGQTQTLEREPEPPAKRPWWKNRWTLAVGTSVAAFVIGMLVLTGFESITGHAVSGGRGTTFGQVVGRSYSGPPTTSEEHPTTTETPTSSASEPSPTSRSQSSSVSSTPTTQEPQSTGEQNTQSAEPTARSAVPRNVQPESAAPSSP